MEQNELTELRNEMRAHEKMKAGKFTIYTGFMVILGISIGIWSIVEGNRARKYQLASEASQKQIDSLEARIAKGTEVLVAMKEKLINGQVVAGHIRVGLDNFYSKRYDMAINEYNQALALDSENFVLYDLRGYSQLRLKRVDEAVASLEKSVALNSYYAWGYYNLTLAYWANNDKIGARKSVQKLLEISPEFRKVILNDAQFQPVLADPEIQRLLNR